MFDNKALIMNNLFWWWIYSCVYCLLICNPDNDNNNKANTQLIMIILTNCWMLDLVQWNNNWMECNNWALSVFVIYFGAHLFTLQSILIITIHSVSVLQNFVPLIMPNDALERLIVWHFVFKNMKTTTAV